MANEDKRSGEQCASWSLTPRRFLSSGEVAALRSCSRARAEARRWSRRSAVLEWIVMEIALETGLRVSEIARLRCGDITLGNGGGMVLVRRGKGGKSRIVLFGKTLASELTIFFTWKSHRGEPVHEAALLFPSKRTGRPITARALQKMFARVAKQAGITKHSFHHLRHTYATHLYHASGNNLRLVQKQLGHASIRTTQVYADVMDDEAEKAVNRLYGKDE